MDIDSYQVEAAKTFQFERGDEESKVICLLGLSGEVGELVTEFKKKIRDGESYTLFSDKVKEEMGDILWYLSSIATQENISMGDVAQKSLKKITDRWEVRAQEGLFKDEKFFDEGRDEKEMLPRGFVVEFSEEEGEGGKKYIHIRVDGKSFGDPLRDNHYVDDYYRFHDIFHFSYAVYLGWSPVVRKLLNKKRKKDERFDEVEDGGRAIVIEEAVSALVFEYASHRDFFENVDGIDYSLIRTVKDLTGHLEVKARTLKEWEIAILQGFSAWRCLRNNNGGAVRCDLLNRTIEVIK